MRATLVFNRLIQFLVIWLIYLTKHDSEGVISYLKINIKWNRIFIQKMYQWQNVEPIFSSGKKFISLVHHCYLKSLMRFNRSRRYKESWRSQALCTTSKVLIIGVIG